MIMLPALRSVLYMADAEAARLADLLSSSVRATNRGAFGAALKRTNTIGFVDAALLPSLVGDAVGGPVVAVLMTSVRQEILAQTIELLSTYPWLSHVVSAALYEKPFARKHLHNLLEQLEHGSDHTAGVGRVAMLARASQDSVPDRRCVVHPVNGYHFTPVALAETFDVDSLLLADKLMFDNSFTLLA